MPAPVRQSSLVLTEGVTAAAFSTTTINGVVAGNTLVAIVAVNSPTSADADICTGYTTTIGGSPANTWTNVLRRRRVNAGGVWYSELTMWIAHNVSAGNTVGRPTFAFDALFAFSHVDEYTGLVTASAVDQTATAFADAGAASISAGPTGTLAVASQTVIAAVMNGYNDSWNGNGTSPGSPPSGFTLLRGNIGAGRNNAQSVYRDVTATTPVSAAWTVNTTYGPSVAGIATLRQGTSALRLEVDNIDVTDITGTSGWTIWAFPGNPKDGNGTEWTAYSAVISSGKLILPSAPAGAAAGATFNVSGYQPLGTRQLAWCTGTVRAA